MNNVCQLRTGFPILLLTLDFDTFFEKSDSTNESKVINQIHRNDNVNFDNSVDFNMYIESIQDQIQPSVNESGISGILSSSEPRCNKESESTQMDYSDLNKRLSVIQEMISSIGENQDSIFTSLSEYRTKNNKLEIENRKLLMKVQQLEMDLIKLKYPKPTVTHVLSDSSESDTSGTSSDTSDSSDSDDTVRSFSYVPVKSKKQHRKKSRKSSVKDSHTEESNVTRISESDSLSNRVSRQLSRRKPKPHSPDLKPAQVRSLTKDYQHHGAYPRQNSYYQRSLAQTGYSHGNKFTSPSIRNVPYARVIKNNTNRTPFKTKEGMRRTPCRANESMHRTPYRTNESTHMGLIMGSIGAVGIMLGVTIVTRGITPPVIVGMVLLFAVISVVTGVIRPNIMTKVSPAPIIPRSLARRLAPRKNLQSFQDHSTHSRLLQKD